MADIFREVDEEIRKDRAELLWKKYGKYVIALCVLLVLGSAGRVAWREYALNQRLEDSSRFSSAVQLSNAGDLDAAIASFESLGNEAGGGYSVIARLREGAARAANDDIDGALGVYNALAADSGVDDLFRQLADIQAVILTLDTAEPGALTARLTPLAQDGRPWRYSARELLALVKYRSGDLDGAKADLQALVDDAGTPGSMKIRVRETLAAISAKG